MISLAVIDEDGSHRLEWFQKPEVRLGRIVTDNDVVLPSPSVSKRHARIVLKDGKHIVVDLKSRNGTYVNGRKITSPLVVKPTDVIYIGPFKLEIVPYDPSSTDDDDTAEVDVVELRLLANVATHEPGAREVYADWLYERDDHVRAEYVRIQDRITSLAEPELALELARLRELGARLDPQWRIKLARQPIENCPRGGEGCPADWGQLTGSRDPALRSCARCQRVVHYCIDIHAARANVVGGLPVVVDLTCQRYPNDLELHAPGPARVRRSTRPGIGPLDPPAVPAEPLHWQPGRCGPEAED